MKDEEIKILKDFIYNDDTEYCWDWHSFDFKTIFPIITQLLNEYEKQNKKMSKLKEYCNDDKNFEILDLYSQDKVDEIQAQLLKEVSE